MKYRTGTDRDQLLAEYDQLLAQYHSRLKSRGYFTKLRDVKKLGPYTADLLVELVEIAKEEADWLENELSILYYNKPASKLTGRQDQDFMDLLTHELEGIFLDPRSTLEMKLKQCVAAHVHNIAICPRDSKLTIWLARYKEEVQQSEITRLKEMGFMDVEIIAKVKRQGLHP